MTSGRAEGRYRTIQSVDWAYETACRRSELLPVPLSPAAGEGGSVSSSGRGVQAREREGGDALRKYRASRLAAFLPSSSVRAILSVASRTTVAGLDVKACCERCRGSAGYASGRTRGEGREATHLALERCRHAQSLEGLERSSRERAHLADRVLGQVLLRARGTSRPGQLEGERDEGQRESGTDRVHGLEAAEVWSGQGDLGQDVADARTGPCAVLLDESPEVSLGTAAPGQLSRDAPRLQSCSSCSWHRATPCSTLWAARPAVSDRFAERESGGEMGAHAWVGGTPGSWTRTSAWSGLP